MRPSFGLCLGALLLLGLGSTARAQLHFPQPAADWGDIKRGPSLVQRFPFVNKGNHAVRTEQYRYIRYADGSEELYDEEKDPYEWTNLASKADMAKVKEALAKFLPKVNKAPVKDKE